MQIEEEIQDSWGSLLRSVDQGKLAHAILLHGKDLSSLTRSAQQLAAYILLKEHPEAEYKITQNIHPDIYNITPTGRGRLHSIEVPREIGRSIVVFPFESSYKIYLVHEADRMVLPAISAFLKVLEEAPKHAVIISTSTQPQRIPATILSRNLLVYLPGEAEHILTPEERNYLSLYIEGKMAISDVGKIVKGNTDADRQAMREKAKYLLGALLYLVRDRVVLSLGGSASLLTYPDYVEEILRLPILPLEKVIVVIEKACESLDHSSSASSCMEWVALQLRSLHALGNSHRSSRH